MSDFNSSLPVRTENPGDVIAKIADATTPSQQLAIDASGKLSAKLNDGAGNPITSQANGAQQALDVGIDVGGVQIDPRSIRALTSADVVTVDQGTTPWVNNITQIGGSAISLGQKVMASSIPVVIASDQSAIPVSQSGAWTVTSNQGTSPWITKDQADGPVAPGTVASFSQLAGGQFNTVLPTLTNGQQAALQVDANGRLLVDSSFTSTDDHNYGVVGANTLRTAAQIGNATGAADFNYGAIGAQSLRVASQIGNATGAADFNAGATSAQTLRVQANQGAPGTNANGWFVRPTDGTNNQSFTAAGEAKVSITEPLPAGTNAIGTVNASNFPTTVDTNYGTVGANTIRTASQIGNATGAADFNNGATGAQTLRVAANLAVGGANVTSLNPVPVILTASASGNAINDFKQAIAVASGSSDNHDYTVTAGKTLLLHEIESSGSGKIKMTAQIETGVATNVFTTKFVQFNSTATPNTTILLQDPISVAAGVRVRIIMLNDDKGAQDLYSTICGQEI